MTHHAQPADGNRPTATPRDARPAGFRTIRTDVAVIGAGPAGSAAALAMARRGLDIQLIEPAPAPTTRLAGEWVHPGGLAALERLGVRLSGTEGWRHHGFAVHPGDGSTPIILNYPGGATALSLPHRVLISALHQQLTAQPSVTWRTGVRAAHLADGVLLCTGPAGDELVQARLVVGAGGRSCVLRDAVGAQRRSATVSHMLGVLVRDVAWPDPYRGHLFLGGPGPVVAYHLSRRTVRVCIDLPLNHPRPPHLAAFVRHAYRHALPEWLHGAIQGALHDGGGQWATNRVQPRGRFAHGHCVLTGDAAGQTHPLTAIGLSMSFLDAECLGRTGDIPGYVRSRATPATVSERLAVGVHRLLSAPDPASVRLRTTAFRLWRQDPAVGERCMALLGLLSTCPADLRHLGLRVMSAGVADSLRAAVRARARDGLLQELRTGAPWLTWLHGDDAHRPG
ncbi:FAD-dependent oxidoreductase [Streptomyces sp. NPDC057798]|uniref:FAD-dependent oxidoreductase n=1 Tax=Streptomyces sp. NPDC057798 TaxID=3346252 RepID=UPI00369A5F49